MNTSVQAALPRAFQCAIQAMTALESILDSDPEREAALESVMRFCRNEIERVEVEMATVPPDGE